MDYLIIPILVALLTWFIAWLLVKIFATSKQFGLQKIVHQIDISFFLKSQNNEQQFEAVLPIIDKQLDDFFKHKLGEKMPAIAMFIGDQTIEQLKIIFIQELRSIYPSMMHKILTQGKHDVEGNLSTQWKSIIESKLMKATKPYRYLSFGIGLVFGILMVMLIHNL